MKYVAIPLISYVPCPQADSFAGDPEDLFQGLEAQALDALKAIGDGDATPFLAEDFETRVIDIPEGRELPGNLADACPVIQRKPATRHFIVSGRIPFDDEDTTFHLEIPPDGSPEDAFTVELYDSSLRELPEDWRTRDNGGDAWSIINAVIEIPGPPVSFCCG